MNKISERLEQLKRLFEDQRNSQLNGYTKMLKILKSLFSSTEHWILEFIQNAEDAIEDGKTGKFAIHVGDDFLWILNSGRPFSDEDFYAICDVNSRKDPAQGYRGYIGIGFKSIFKITDYIEIHSGDFHFCFNKERWVDKLSPGKDDWPWEILPVEVEPRTLKEGYTTGFYIPFKNKKAYETFKNIQTFLESKFPHEIIIQLTKVNTIEICTPNNHLFITKGDETVSRLDLFNSRIVKVTKSLKESQQKNSYLVFRKVVEVPDYIKEDEETNNARRSNIKEREIGIIFALDEHNDIFLNIEGNLRGVYSFLPIEGEQTGLPFSIFGDFIPMPGRDNIKYNVKWNEWMCERIVELFKEVVRSELILNHERWKFSPTKILSKLPSRYDNSFWHENLGKPIKRFLEDENVHFSKYGTCCKLTDLIIVEDDLEEVFGEDKIEEFSGKKIASPEITEDIKNIKYNECEMSVYKILYNQEWREKALQYIVDDLEKLISLYHKLNGYRGYEEVEFILGEDKKFYKPKEIMSIQTELSDIPEFLKSLVPKDKKILHPEIAKDNEAIEQLKRCGVEVIDKQALTSKLKEKIEKISYHQDCPEEWRYPRDLIEATLFLIRKYVYENDWNFRLQYFVSDGETLQPPSNLFIPEAKLDWLPLWKRGYVPGFQPIHELYLDPELLAKYSLTREQLNEFFKNNNVRGFNPEQDKQLIEQSAMKIAEIRLRESGHIIERVEQRDELGYDLQCIEHCEKVFEVKGMYEPKDIELKPKEYEAILKKKEKYVLICVYNLPNVDDKIGYREIPNVKELCVPVEKAKISKDKWWIKQKNSS